jgi:RNA polymerase sigma-70 factor (ECF subfamily)
MEQIQTNINYNIEVVLEKYSNMVRRICFMYLHNMADVEDVFQEVFLKLILKKEKFESEEHEKAWLIRITINKCKDLLKSFGHRNVDTIEDLELPFEDELEGELLKVVLELPEKYKEVIYLYYYEEYTVPQIAKLLKTSHNTIYSQIDRAREIIKQKLGGKENEYTF